MGLRRPHKFCEGINLNMSVKVFWLLRDAQHKHRKALVRAGFAGPKLTLLLLPLVPDRFHSKLIIIMKARSEREDLHRGSENTQTQWEERKTREMALLWARCLLLKGVRELGCSSTGLLGTVVKCKEIKKNLRSFNYYPLCCSSVPS